MDEKYFYLLTLYFIDSLQAHHSWCGETHIQKNMYIFDAIFNRSNELKFTLYKHGPYSFILHDIINNLYGLCFIEAEQRPPYGPRIRLTEQGHIFMNKNPINEITQINQVSSNFGEESVQGLEKLATALLIFNENQEENPGNRAEILHKIKPHIDIKDALEATNKMDQIRNMIITQFNNDTKILPSLDIDI